LPLEVHDEVFAFVLKIAKEKGLLGGRTVAMDATRIEANAAMKSIVRRDTGDDWKAYVRKRMEEAAMDQGYPSASFLAEGQGGGIRT